MIIIIKKIILPVSLVLFMILSCSNRSLSLFFDGVPNADSTKSTDSQPLFTPLSDSSSQKLTKETVIINGAGVYHPDYRQKKCEKCHQLEHGYRLNQRQPELCYQCHKNINDQYKKIHGPVAAGFCSTCHQPHKSQFSALLKMSVRDVCRHCHEPGDIVKNNAHQRSSKTECLECHNPHGGDTANLLRIKKDG